MSVILKNVTDSDKIYAGQIISASNSYTIQSVERHLFVSELALLSDIINGDCVVSDGTNDLEASIGIDHLKGYFASTVDVGSSPAFTAKTVLVGGVEKKLYKRVHGANGTILAGETGNIDFVISYGHAKFTGANIFGSELKDTLNFYILDTATNAYSGAPISPEPTYYPNFILNQFGFNAELPASGIYENTSNYDADLYMGMIIRCEYTNNGASDKYIALNAWLHEVV